MKTAKQTKKTFIIIGLGRFGASIAKNLSEMNYDILAIDINEDRVAAVASFMQNCTVADSTKLSVLDELGVNHIDHAVVAIGGNLEASILTVMNLKKFNVKRISVRADEEAHKEIFLRLGADEVIIPEEAAAISLANQAVSDTILDYYPIAEGYSIIKVIVGERFEPKTIAQMNIRVQFDVNILGIFKDAVFSIPKPSDRICPGDRIVLVGSKENYNKFVEYIGA